MPESSATAPRTSGASENEYLATMLASTELVDENSTTLDDVLASNRNEDEDSEDDDEVASDKEDRLLADDADDNDELIVLLDELLRDDWVDWLEPLDWLERLLFMGLLLDELEFRLEVDDVLLDDVS